MASARGVKSHFCDCPRHCIASGRYLAIPPAADGPAMGHADCSRWSNSPVAPLGGKRAGGNQSDCSCGCSRRIPSNACQFSSWNCCADECCDCIERHSPSSGCDRTNPSLPGFVPVQLLWPFSFGASPESLFSPTEFRTHRPNSGVCCLSVA